MKFYKFIRLLPIAMLIAVSLGGWADQNQREGPAPRLNTNSAHLRRNPQQQNVYSPPQSIHGACVMDPQSLKTICEPNPTPYNCAWGLTPLVLNEAGCGGHEPAVRCSMTYVCIGF